MTILVLSPHTDDAEIAAGGTMAKWAAEGNRVVHVAFSPATNSLPDGFPPDATRKEFDRACDVLMAYGRVLGFPTRRFPERRQAVLDVLMELRRELNPDIVLGPSQNDIHQDHHVVAREMMRAFRRDASVLGYEHARNDNGFRPQMWSAVPRWAVKAKLDAVACYESQTVKGMWLNPQYLTAHMAYRGGQVGLPHAEAFEVLRWRM